MVRRIQGKVGVIRPMDNRLRLEEQRKRLLEVTCLRLLENSNWFILDQNKLPNKPGYQRVFRLYPNSFMGRYYWQDEWENDLTFEEILKLVDPEIQYVLLCHLNVLRDTN